MTQVRYDYTAENVLQSIDLDASSMGLRPWSSSGSPSRHNFVASDEILGEFGYDEPLHQLDEHPGVKRSCNEPSFNRIPNGVLVPPRRPLALRLSD